MERSIRLIAIAADVAYTQLELYTNGIASPVTDDVRPLDVYNSPLDISGLTGAGQDVHGSVDEVAVYDYALSAERARLHYTIGTSGPQ